jgi:hypothetical protein
MTKQKATKKITKFDMSADDATISLVGPAVGGAANGFVTLLTKANKKVSEEFLKKASQVTVTMDITEYLETFFGLWETDAELLARSLGFTTSAMEDAAEDAQEMADGTEEPDEPDFCCDPESPEVQAWINYKLKSINVMKSLHNSENIEKSLTELSEKDYLQLLQDQEVVEKVLQDIKKGCGKRPVKKNSTAVAEDASTNVHVEKKNEEKSSVVKNKNKEGSMAGNEELIAKSEFEAIQKQLEDQKTELQKAFDQISKFEKEKKEAIAKARKEQLTKACGKHADVIFKACGEASEEVFIAVVKALSEMQQMVEKSAMYSELGVSVGDSHSEEESPIAKALKARLTKSKE